MDKQLHAAARIIHEADALLIAAGAGMGVDSGLPDFRGPEGFWRAYPPYAKLGLRFTQLANPRWFRDDPTLAWGFYGHRLNTYRTATPHAGFQILRQWAAGKPRGVFVFTSNVDGHFQKAGFAEEQVAEVHGSVYFLQCSRRCGIGIYPTGNLQVKVDEATMRALEPLPACPGCGALARPNILMFDDHEWDSGRTDEQSARLEAWAGSLIGARLAIVECGAGTAVPTVRWFCERLARAANGTLIRINVREPEVPDDQIGVGMGALDALRRIDALLRG